jgi:hypothetical protein
MTRPTDADVDALSHVYQASWKGATFNWAGADVGYIVRVTPKNFTAPALPDFDRVSDAELVALLESPSHRTRLEAQRTLLRRELNAETTARLLALAREPAKPLVTRVAAVYAITQRAFGGNVDAAVAGLTRDVALQPYVLRALADGGKDAPTDAFAAGLASAEAQVKLEAIIGAVHRNLTSLAPQIAALLGDAEFTKPVSRSSISRKHPKRNAPARCLRWRASTRSPSSTGCWRDWKKKKPPRIGRI